MSRARSATRSSSRWNSAKKSVVIARSAATKQSRSDRDSAGRDCFASLAMTSVEVKAMSIEDRLAISELFVRYATALDAGDVETVVDCFTEGAVLESPVIAVIAGHEAISAFAARFAAQRAGGTQFRHMVTNIAAEILSGGDRARAS